ncbi:hypothetical protein H9P43_006212 [Blastocladiella emersonii ATCC 22665]|nr:hypothetical protein H9P43_006212 [Blastocladiella emersonii ATCC 22665]
MTYHDDALIKPGGHVDQVAPPPRSWPRRILNPFRWPVRVAAAIWVVLIAGVITGAVFGIAYLATRSSCHPVDASKFGTTAARRIESGTHSLIGITGIRVDATKISTSHRLIVNFNGTQPGTLSYTVAQYSSSSDPSSLPLTLAQPAGPVWTLTPGGRPRSFWPSLYSLPCGGSTVTKLTLPASSSSDPISIETEGYFHSTYLHGTATLARLSVSTAWGKLVQPSNGTISLAADGGGSLTFTASRAGDVVLGRVAVGKDARVAVTAPEGHAKIALSPLTAGWSVSATLGRGGVTVRVPTGVAVDWTAAGGAGVVVNKLPTTAVSGSVPGDAAKQGVVRAEVAGGKGGVVLVQSAETGWADDDDERDGDDRKDEKH